MIEIFGYIVGIVAIVLLAKWLERQYENKDVEPLPPVQPKREDATPQINLPKFADSGWVVFYGFCGCISLVAMIGNIVQENSTYAFTMLGCSLSCFFAAHILRIQEKAAFFAEQSVEESKKQTEESKKQTELLEKISSEKSPIIEDKE